MRLALPMLLFAAPLARGLFLPPEQLVFDVLAFGTMSAVCVVCYRRGIAPWSDDARLLYAIAGLALAYGVAIAGAARTDTAILAALGMAAACCAFVVGRHLPIVEASGRRVVHAVVGAAAAASVFGLGLFIGSWTWQGGLIAGRIGSTFQYPNTFAAFVIGAAACSVSGALTSSRERGRWAYRAATAVMGLAFAFAVSRATALGFPIVVAVHAALAPRGVRARVAMEWFIATIAVLVAVRPISRAVSVGDPATAWEIVTAAVVGACVLGWAVIGLAEGIQGRSVGRPLRLAALIAVAVIAMAAVGWLVEEAVPTLVAIRVTGTPAATEEMAVGRQIGPQNLTFRLLVMADAARAILDRPWLGFGGGAWRSLFSLYQSTGYVSREVHSFPIQLGFETGLFGAMLLVLTALFVLRTMRTALRAHRGGPQRLWVAGAVAAIAAIVGHSLVDWDLSFLSLQVVVAALLGTLDGSLPGTAPPSARVAVLAIDDTRGRVVSAIFGAVAFGLFLFSARLAVAEYHAWRGSQKVAVGDYAGAALAFERAVRFNPWASPHHKSLAEALLNRHLRGGAPELATAAVRAAGAAVATNRYHADTHLVLAKAYLEAGEAEAAARTAAEAVRLERFQTRHYAMLGDAQIAAAAAALATGDQERAAAHLARVLEIPGRMEAVRAEQRRYGWGQAPSVTAEVSLVLGQAYALRGEWARAEPLLRRAKFEGRLVQQADPWLVWVYDQVGRKRDADPLRGRAWVQAAFADRQFAQALRLAPVR